MKRYMFPLGLFVSASLLFIIQPMVAKILLPTYGGTPAVWTICLLFFQTILLLSCAYVWGLSHIRNTIVWRSIHVIICIVSLFFFPFNFSPIIFFNTPETNILFNLICQFGFPLFIIGTSSSLFQHAFSQTTRHCATDPYFLYSASNTGSLFALLLYPYILERYFDIHQQLFGWNVIYITYLILLFSVLFFEKYQRQSPNKYSSTRLSPEIPSLHHKTCHSNTLISCFYWMFQSFIACGLMLSVTFYISTDIAATPLFWIIPLALYLLSFIITFAKKPFILHTTVSKFSLFCLLLPLVGFIIGENQMPAWLLIFTNISSFFILALLCHGNLVLTKPSSQHLSLFYFCLSLGGVCAGLFNGLLAPKLFSHAYEYPLLLLMASLCLSLPRKKWEGLIPCIILILLSIHYEFYTQTTSYLFMMITLFLILRAESTRSLFLSLSILLLFIFMPWSKSSDILSQQRNFYGIKQVASKYGAHVLISQNTAHGFQIPGKANPLDGTRAYYAPVLPVIHLLETSQKPIQAMIIGLGTGMMACQFQKEDALTFIEIDEQVIDIAKNTKFFTYLRDCPPNPKLILNDGLLAMKKISDNSAQLIVIDAFQSDAVPVHLLTLESFHLYQKKMAQNGVLMINITNRHLRILPVLTAAGRALDMIVLHKTQSQDQRSGQLASEWVLLTTNESLATHLLVNQHWRFVTEKESILWTNNYSNIIPLLKWGTEKTA